MPQSTFSQEWAGIIREIFDKYHYDSGIAITGDRCFIYHCPRRLERLHYKFNCLAIAYVPPGKEGDYMRELKQVHKAMKIEYAKLKKIKERKMFYDRIKSVLKF